MGTVAIIDFERFVELLLGKHETHKSPMTYIVDFELNGSARQAQPAGKPAGPAAHRHGDSARSNAHDAA